MHTRTRVSKSFWALGTNKFVFIYLFDLNFLKLSNTFKSVKVKLKFKVKKHRGQYFNPYILRENKKVKIFNSRSSLINSKY